MFLRAVRILHQKDDRKQQGKRDISGLKNLMLFILAVLGFHLSVKSYLRNFYHSLLSWEIKVRQ
jgi:hypothetical protein